MCFSLSRSPRAGSTCQASPPIQIPSGLPSRPATSRLKIASPKPSSCSGTATPSTRGLSMRCFTGEGVRVIRSPIQSPRANAFAERFVRTARRECLDHVLVLGEGHLRRILREYVSHYNQERPHRGLSLQTPEPRPILNCADGEIVRVDRLGGLVHEYRRLAA